ncbi:radical SAM protein [Ruminiclostridium herbifermentans]|uniref:Radical SAM protein n=1 Tax=Ruminiclostridium herbifermentans TaxID=2488810 RepID=A0A4U7JIV8_9FIRM|nr:radical SAM/SPASM domain-containing protein [Ruminiclostridium herbifermentans]QNU67139.1 radical SAM protein [Ruminiclostridium herbifermentans]
MKNHKKEKYKKVYIEITNICNLNCNFCPSTKRQLKYMKKQEFLHVISQVRPFTDYIYFHLMGEPLLNPELEDFLEICKNTGLQVNLTTNGTLLKKNTDILLNAPALRKVSISLHSFEANDTQLDMQEYLDDTINFAKEASKMGIICELRLWNGDSEGIIACNKLNSHIFDIIERTFNIDYSLQAALRQSNNIKLQDKLFLHLAQKFEWPDMDSEIIDEGVFCYGLRDQFGILVDGTVVPCCLDNEGNIPLGNIFNDTLSNILNSERAKKIYAGFTARTAVEELCKKCGYAKRHKR